MPPVLTTISLLPLFSVRVTPLSICRMPVLLIVAPLVFPDTVPECCISNVPPVTEAKEPLN